MKPHALANLFPLMNTRALAELSADIKSHGLREPIITLDGKILDGRNRFRACAKARVKPRFKSYSGKDPLAFVFSINLKRRHLNESQRAWVASKLATMKQGARTDLEPSANLRKVDQATAATMLNVSERSIQSAIVVRDHGTLELQRAVEQGHLAVSLGAKAAMLPKIKQRLIAARAENGKSNAVRTVIKQGVRRQHEKNLGARQIALPSKKYGVIYADPEWKFEMWGEPGSVKSCPEYHFATSTLTLIKRRKVERISADDCTLFLWATVPMLPQALEVMAAWGFAYKSHFVWIKNKVGTGYWNRNAHELLLVGSKGNPPLPAMGTQSRSFIEAPVGRHSEKPEAFLELIERTFPTLPKIELNRRGRARPGWDAWGNEAQAVAAE
jgi:N6-adenosine-specific RNA methylase IME4